MRWLIFVALLVAPATGQESATPASSKSPDHPARIREGTDLFRKSVRNTLSQQCLSCHGGDTLEGEFNISTRAGLLKGGDKGPAIVPGKSRSSLLYRLITHAEQPHMPYDEDRLSDRQIADIARWIDLEAPYDKPLVEGTVDLKDWTERQVAGDARDFWSFRPLAKATPPKLAEDNWSRTPADQFVLARLRAAGLTPNGPADRRTLIRRVYFDVIGLPPEPDELRRLMKSSDSDWYEQMVDELLERPEFGERWARHWLDIARFAESHGFEQDYNREFAYHYRDFVIQAFNMDLPFDQFVQWQLAGDEIESENPLALMATGFLGAGVFPTQLTEKEFEPARYDELDDMVATMGTAMLGMTIGCARCHDHKFDPIPAADYYRLVSTFSTTIRSHVQVDLNKQQTARAVTRWQGNHAKLVQKLKDFERSQLPARLDKWLATPQPDAPTTTGNEWLVLHPASMTSSGGATLTLMPDRSVLATGPNPDFDTYTFTADTHIREIRAIRLEALSHKSMVRGGPGRASNGNMGVGSFKMTAQPLWGDAKPVEVRLQNPRATFQQNTSNLSIAATIDGAKRTGWAVDPQFGKNHAAVFELEKPIGFPDGTRLTFTLVFDVNNKHNIGRTRLSVTGATEALAFDGAERPQGVGELIRSIKAETAPSGTQRERLLSVYKAIDPEWQKLSAAVTDSERSKPKPQTTTVMVSTEGLKPLKHHADGRGFPHFYKETFFLKRGDTGQKVRPATPGFLQVLTTADNPDQKWLAAPPEGARTSHRRRQLARWITDTEHGSGQLLARVIVNRLWQHHMGRGIVATPNDFGKQGERPSHPQLLDWLAQKLIDDGWHLKSLHRLILNSQAYCQSTLHDAARESIDPENRLMWRRAPRRLEAEIIRDAMLAVSGELDRTQFGAGTLDESSKRRSIYFMVKRSKLIPMMQIFDSPEPLASVGNRPSTTIASQALMFMNSPHVRGYARSLAKRAADQETATAITNVYTIALARDPDAQELADAGRFLTAQSNSYTADGKSPADAATLALTDLCQTILSLNEFVFVE